ncbi:MAG: hypothetical protein R2780_13405 [Crocinitomicaceae bacterium]|nr:hypothetical protein [Crocinitomicaceae bacterium]
MKLKTIFFLSVLSLLSISCKKNYTCSCEDHYGAIYYTGQIENSSEQEARDECASHFNFAQGPKCTLTVNP